MKTIVSALLLGVAAWWLPAGAVEATARTLVLAVALMAAGVFPCMTLVVNSMKGEQRTPALIEELFGQLHRLLKVLVAAFAVAVVSVLALSATSALAASGADDFLVRSSAAICGFLLGMLAGRAITIGKAFFAVLEINRKQALLIARKDIRIQRDNAIAEGRREQFKQDDPRPRQLKKVS